MENFSSPGSSLAGTPQDTDTLRETAPRTGDSLPVPQPTQSNIQLMVRYRTEKFSNFNDL